MSVTLVSLAGMWYCYYRSTPGATRTHDADIGISSTTATSILSAIGGISMAGWFVIGIAIDRIGNRRSMIIWFVRLNSALLWLQVAKELWMLFLFAVVYGFANGGLLSVTIMH